MRWPTRHAATAALGALAALVIHQLAYLLAYPGGASRGAALGDHRFLPTQWSLVTPLAGLASAWFVLHQVRQLRATRLLVADLGVRPLALGGAGLFAGQEAVEATLLHHGLRSLAANRALYIGTALAPLVAAAMVNLLRGARELEARRWASPPPVHPPARFRPVPIPLRCAAASRRSGPSPRGPPR